MSCFYISNKWHCKACMSIYSHLKYKKKKPKAKRVRPYSERVPDMLVVEALRKYTSIVDAFESVGLPSRGSGIYVKARRLIQEYDIDTSHFLGQGHNRGQHRRKRPIQDYFSGKSRPHSTSLRQRLIEEGFKFRKCENCGRKTWNNQDIPLELHHIDSNHHNNQLENLQLLCPNCHAQIENRGIARSRRDAFNKK